MIQVIRDDELYHFGKGHDDNPPGRGSGRWAWGTTKDGKKTKKVREGVGKANNAVTTAKKVTSTAKEVKNAQKDANAKAKADALDFSDMSNKELQDYITRQGLENNYRQLYEKEERRKEGKDWIDNVLDHADEALEVVGGALTVAALIMKITGKGAFK